MLKEDKLFLKQVYQIVHEQMKQGHVNCDTVSASLCMTNQHLRRRILALTGTTGGVYLLGIRMQYAKQLLASPRNYAIATVALKCGYEDSNNFSRTFKRVVGQTPSEYAKSCAKK